MSKKRKAAPSEVSASQGGVSPDQLLLLSAPEAAVENPNEVLREAARSQRLRRQWRTRQKRCRASKKMREQVARVLAESPVVDSERTDARLEWEDERIIAWCRAEALMWGAVQLGGPIAARVFDALEPRHFDPPLDLVFDAAKAIHQRGHLVTREGVLAELKARKVILLRDPQLGWFERLAKALPPQVTPHLIDEGVECLKQA